MTPIFNPTTTAVDADTQYFTDLGLLTGMEKLIDATGGNTYPTPDASRGTAAAVGGNILQWGAATADSWQGYDLAGGPYTRLLSIVYIYPSTAQYQYLFNNKAALDPATNYPADAYGAVNSPHSVGSSLYKITATVWTSIGLDMTMYAPVVITSPPYGYALYTSYTGGAGSQRMFLKMGAAEWVQMFSTSDGDTQEFQSVTLWTQATNQRAITPLTVWGA